MTVLTPIDELRDKVAILESFVGHLGWTDYLGPKILRRQAAEMMALQKDVGNVSGKSDFIRGQLDILQWMLRTVQDDLKDAKAQLAELTGTGAPAKDDDSLPPV